MSTTGDRYEHNKIGYNEILHNRRTRPRPQPTLLIGQGTAQESFVVETENPRPAHWAKRLSDVILLPDNVADILPESIGKNNIPGGK